MKNFYLIGLTGNLGTGKSTVRHMLEELGAYGIDADKLAHIAMQRGTKSWNAIVQTFGAEILQFNGRINRQKLGEVVFGDPVALRRLEAIVHPAVDELIREYLRQTNANIVVLEAIKLVESGLVRHCDAVWVVTASHEAEIRRVMRDRHMSEDDAIARLEAQGSPEDKLKLANVVIDNSHDPSKTRAQVENAWKNFVKLDNAGDKSEWLYGSSAIPSPVAPNPEIEPLPPIHVVPTSEPASAPPVEQVESKEEPASPAKGESRPVVEDELEPFARLIRRIVPPEAPVEPAAPAPSAAERVRPSGEQAPESKPSIRDEAKVESSSPSSQTLGKSAEPALEHTTVESAPQGEEIASVEVRRARRGDLDAIAIALAIKENLAEPLPRPETIKRFGKWGYRVAVSNNRIVALAAWEAENLVAITQDLWAESPMVAERALPPLLALIEQDARDLQCEVSLIVLGDQAPALVSSLVRGCNYQPREIKSLHRVWRQIAEERVPNNKIIWVKPLRDGFVTKPV